LYDRNGIGLETAEILVERQKPAVDVECESKLGDRQLVRVRVRDVVGKPLAADVAIVVTKDATTTAGMHPWSEEISFDRRVEPVSTRIRSLDPQVPWSPKVPHGGRVDQMKDFVSGAWRGLSWTRSPDGGAAQHSPFTVGLPTEESNFVLVPWRLPGHLRSAWTSLFAEDRASDAAPLATSDDPVETLWFPHVATDEHGEALVEFVAPKGPHRWRIEAFVAGRDGDTFARGSAVIDEAP
jgi:hypothetical protein